MSSRIPRANSGAFNAIGEDLAKGTVKNGGVANAMEDLPRASRPPETIADNVVTVNCSNAFSDGCQKSEHAKSAFLGIGYPTILNGSYPH